MPTLTMQPLKPGNAEPVRWHHRDGWRGRPPLSALLFDMGDVLFDATVWRRWLLQTLGRMGLKAHYRSFYYLWDHDFLGRVHRGNADYDNAFREFLACSGLKPAQVDEIAQASLVRRRELANTTRPFPGVVSTLSRLHEAGLHLAIVSDSESRADELRARLRGWAIDHLLAAVVSSRDIAHCKPEPVCYLHALETLAARPDQAAFVGHDAEELDGARAVGLRTIAFNYDANARADVYLARFNALADVAIDAARGRSAAA